MVLAPNAMCLPKIDFNAMGVSVEHRLHPVRYTFFVTKLHILGQRPRNEMSSIWYLIPK